ncbi:MAG TPA: cupin domain-containing protein [Propionibacteriaceae bacterium]|nr:cupin domain-containing protein [Propionibacteriaceae bacterium]
MEQLPQRPTGKGAPAQFIGDVYVDAVTGPDAGCTVVAVHFTPGARNAWHTHATGQTLHCTEGYGLVVTDDEVIALRPGVTAWTPPGQRHWHAAMPDSYMSHLAISATPVDPDTPVVVWAEHVADEEYESAVARARTA